MTGIISAMQEEIQLLISTLENCTITTKGQRKYYQGTLFNKPVVLVFSRWGKVAAAITTTQLINDFNVTEIVFSGVAGGINHKLAVGDVVIGKRLYQHDVDARPFFEKFEIPILAKKYFETSENPKLNNAVLQFKNNYNNYINKNDALEFDITTPTIFNGDIASGDQFISDTQKVTKLKETLPNLLCVEMEGASVAQVCYEYDIPFSIIRIISDNANESATVDFVKFSNTIACNYALGIFGNYLKN